MENVLNEFEHAVAVAIAKHGHAAPGVIATFLISLPGEATIWLGENSAWAAAHVLAMEITNGKVLDR
jgi:hypothetical protein